MTRFRNDKTKGGLDILFLSPPDAEGYISGVINIGHGRNYAFDWDREGGSCTSFSGLKRDEKYDLVPVEPEIQYHTACVKGLNGYDDNGNSVQLVRAHFCPGSFTIANLKLGFDAETGKLLTAEVLND